MRNSKEIRQSFVDFFKKRGHQPVSSSATIPYNDPTLLFTNAGMNQFKGIFVGEEKAQFPRAVTVQKVIRAGGKHNDLENVGYTARHHTFFEMLGNFSFGDYFKEQAIVFAWEWLTLELGLNPDKLAVSVFHQDQVALDLWHKKIGLPLDRIALLGEKDNFWAMGDTGPCGPCSEIHYDLYPVASSYSPRESLERDEGRFLEIWNLVFMQYEKKPGLPMIDLPKPSIDTGCGLERIASVLQGVYSNYDTDLFQYLIQKIARTAKIKYGENENTAIACRVIADHIRSTSIILADGAVPSNEGRGYVLRRIIRRALRYTELLKLPPHFLAELSLDFSENFGLVYPELPANLSVIQSYLSEEEDRFSLTLKRGLEKIGQLVTENQNRQEVSGRELFKLYDTYGFPLDLAADILKENHLTYNYADFEREMDTQREKARTELAKKLPSQDLSLYKIAQDKLAEAEFVGYTSLSHTTSGLALFQEGRQLPEVDGTKNFSVYFAASPFYATGGGQEGDQGWLAVGGQKFKVIRAYRPLPGFPLHEISGRKGSPKIALSDFAVVQLEVDRSNRQATARNHTATHLLHAGLRSVLGLHIKQAGSLVDGNRLRFDFTHPQPISHEALDQIESFVLENIAGNYAVETRLLPLQEALKTGAMAFFGDKYGEMVRLVQAGPNSLELCGGTHVLNTGDLALFKIVSEQGIAAGVRRIEALTTLPALKFVQKRLGQWQDVVQALNCKEDELLKVTFERQQRLKELETQLKRQSVALLRHELEQALKSQGAVAMLEVPTDAKLEVYNEVLSQNYAERTVLLVQKTPQRLILAVVKGNRAQTTKTAQAIIQDLSLVVKGRGGGGDHYAQCSGALNAQKEAQDLFFSLSA